jgi:outer membrane protein assembly factor BamA
LEKQVFAQKRIERVVQRVQRKEVFSEVNLVPVPTQVPWADEVAQVRAMMNQLQDQVYQTTRKMQN